MEILPSKLFRRNLKKLSRVLRLKTEQRDEIFRNNPFDPRLKTHKLHGEKKGEWAYSIDRSFRITFVFIENGKVVYTNIGTHDELY